MENYKIINAELVSQLQAMRIHISDYQKDIVKLRADLLDERKLRVEQEQQFQLLVTRNFCKTMKQLNADVNIYKLLTAVDELDTEGDSESATRSKSVMRHSSRRSSAEIIQELRRSVAIQQRSSGVMIASPTRRRSSMSDCYSNVSMEIEEEELAADEQVQLQQSSANDIDESQIYCIIEENEPPEEEQHVTKTKQTTVEGKEKNKSNAKLKVSVLRQSLSNSPLRDLTNCQLKPLSPLEFSPPESVSHVAMYRGKRRSLRTDSIDNARCANSLVTVPYHKSDENIREYTLQSSLGELTIGNFVQEASSSTPQNTAEGTTLRRKSLRTTNTITDNNQTNNLTTDINENSRPRRKCLPANYKELNINRKQRNESLTSKSKSTSKKRK